MNKLVKILRLQAEKYRQSKAHAEKQKQFLINTDDEAFQQTIPILEHLMNELKLLEKDRKKELQKQDNTVADSDKAIIRLLTEEIQNMAADIKKINECNLLLLKNKLEFIKFNINVITRATADVPYQASGDIAGNAMNKIKMFDQSI
ncbi:flagellar export chaperone FlgN [Pectinatus haikarae]|uniref:Flagellar biosynthesis/type III secretory pathway chaperone n=1 Tax=Pectinatus haikarae TaxID=349096 RepID=A0ABT9Y5N6_9FIRM|nr:flagellar export chaperone FlgN [Pectinatus haikarae]MDQ0202830.1 flagellar biosynthesis/type III secretory pathway chaperone [Pectinatus haikarae]